MWGHSFSNKEHQAGIRKRGPIRPNQFAAHCNVYLDQLILRTVSTQDYTLFGQDKVQKSKSKLHAGGCLSRSIIIYKWFTSAEKAGYCSPHYTQSSRTGSDRRLTTASFISLLLLIAVDQLAALLHMRRVWPLRTPRNSRTYQPSIKSVKYCIAGVKFFF